MVTEKTLGELLLARGVDHREVVVRLLRHADKRYPLFRYIGTTALTQYQSLQTRPFDPGDLIVAFFGRRAGYGLLLGVWRVEERIDAEQAVQRGLLNCDGIEPPEEWKGYFHVLQELDLLSDLRLRLEVEWTGEVAWRRVLKSFSDYPTRVIGDCPVAFSGLNNVSLVMAELRMVIDDLMWKRELAAMGGIYLIPDERTGKQYVGSAYGGEGVHQRWRGEFAGHPPRSGDLPT